MPAVGMSRDRSVETIGQGPSRRSRLIQALHAFVSLSWIVFPVVTAFAETGKPPAAVHGSTKNIARPVSARHAPAGTELLFVTLVTIAALALGVAIAVHLGGLSLSFGPGPGA